ncbi:MAG: Cna B-type domain-containing protein, partial [Oscillospiraceae bacterium]|nr:Cna B-type domain-containing protein [Oscillospiraceae bacterium]
MRKRLISLLLVLVMVISLGGVSFAFADDDTTGETAGVTDETGESTEGQSAESQETESQEAGSQEAESQETESQETESQEVESQEAESQEVESQETAGALTSTNMLTSTEGDTSVYDDLAARLAALAEEVYALTAEDTEALTAAYNTLLGISDAIDAALEDGSITEEQEQALGAVYSEIDAYINNPVEAADNQLTDETYLWENLTNPDEDENGDVTLTVVTTDGETETYQYANIMDAVKKLFSYMNHGDNYQTTSSYSATTTWYNPNGRGYNWSDVGYTWDYVSAEISFTEAHCEYITTSVQFKSSTSGWQYASLSNVTFDGNGTGSIVGDPAQSYSGDVVVSGGTYGNAYGYGSYSNLKGTLTISGDNCTIKNISFVGNHTWAFTYYTQDNAIGVGSGVTNLTIQNNSFEGYTLVTAFGQSGGTVTNEVFTGNTVSNCLFLFHTADGGVKNLTVTNNTLTGSAQYTLASCMAYTTIAEFSGNTLTYASFGLQNCDTDMEQFLAQNTYDHGFIYQETVDYNSGLGYYYLPSSTTVMTVLPEGASAVWRSDYDTAGEMDAALTYTQQDAVDDAYLVSDDPTYATLTWTGGGTDEDGKVLDGGVAIGYNYTAMHLDYAYSYVDVTVTKEWDDAEDQDGIRPESITVALVKNGETTDKTVTLSEENNWTASFENLPQYANSKEIEYTVEEVSIDGYTTEITEVEGGYTVTNSHTPETTSVTVTKAWDDEDDQDGLQPESVTVTLYAGNTAVATATLNGDNGWTYTFTGLAKYSAGTEIEYTVEE